VGMGALLRRAVPYVGWTARIALGSIFVWASFAKIQDPALFADAVMQYEILPNRLVGIFALIFPMVELLTGLLILTKWKREAALIMSGMLVMFMIALVSAMLRGLDIECGCFGEEEGDGGGLPYALLRDVVMLIPAIWIAQPFQKSASCADGCGNGEK